MAVALGRGAGEPVAALGEDDGTWLVFGQSSGGWGQRRRSGRVLWAVHCGVWVAELGRRGLWAARPRMVRA